MGVLKDYFFLRKATNGGADSVSDILLSVEM